MALFAEDQHEAPSPENGRKALNTFGCWDAFLVGDKVQVFNQLPNDNALEVNMTAHEEPSARFRGDFSSSSRRAGRRSPHPEGRSRGRIRLTVCHIDGMAGSRHPRLRHLLEDHRVPRRRSSRAATSNRVSLTPLAASCFKLPVNPSPRFRSRWLRGRQRWQSSRPPDVRSFRHRLHHPRRIRDHHQDQHRLRRVTSDIDLQFNYGSGFDNTGAANRFINHGYLNSAGITAGKANSFFSFFGGRRRLGERVLPRPSGL